MLATKTRSNLTRLLILYEGMSPGEQTKPVLLERKINYFYFEVVLISLWIITYARRGLTRVIELKLVPGQLVINI